MALKRNALGRGLDSLIPMDDVPARGTSAINDIPLDSISPNPDQPRKLFDDVALEELAASVRQLGIIQPLSLRKIGQDSYQIIAGERRYRAALMAGLTSVPAYIRTANDLELTEMALIENIQREDLNAIEIALTFRKLIDQYQLTQEELSKRIGKKTRHRGQLPSPIAPACRSAVRPSRQISRHGSRSCIAHYQRSGFAAQAIQRNIETGAVGPPSRRTCQTIRERCGSDKNSP